MTDFILRDNIDSNDPLEYVVVMDDIEYGRWYRSNDARDHAGRIASEQLTRGRSALVEVILDHPGNTKHGEMLCWIEIAWGEAT